MMKHITQNFSLFSTCFYSMLIHTKCLFLCFLIITQWSGAGSIIIAFLLVWKIVVKGIVTC